jgi:hypothetical protein
MNTKQERHKFMDNGGMFIRKREQILMIVAKTKDKDWHYFRKCNTKKALDIEFNNLLKSENIKTY